MLILGKPMVVSEYSVILIALVFDMCLGAALLGTQTSEPNARFRQISQDLGVHLQSSY